MPESGWFLTIHVPESGSADLSLNDQQPIDHGAIPPVQLLQHPPLFRVCTFAILVSCLLGHGVNLRFIPAFPFRPDSYPAMEKLTFLNRYVAAKIAAKRKSSKHGTTSSTTDARTV